MRVILDLSEAESEGLIELFGKYGFVIDQRYGMQPRCEEALVLRCVGEFPDLQVQFIEALRRTMPCIVRLQRLPLMDEPLYPYWVVCDEDRASRIQQAFAALDAKVLGFVHEMDGSRIRFKILYAGPLSALEDIEGVWDAVLAAPDSDHAEPEASERPVLIDLDETPTGLYACVPEEEDHRLPLHIELHDMPRGEEAVKQDAPAKTRKLPNGD